jgi:hypothetical protein
MKVKNLLSLLTLLIAVAITIVSCSHYNMEKAEKNISKNADDESHNNGLNCMNCHKTGGKGEGWFNIAGSVYKSDNTTPNGNGKVYLYTDPDGQGTLKYTLEVDALGNFFTTETANFEGGLYPVHENTQGVKKYMQTPIITGQCQSCHNVTTPKIWND